MSTRLNQPIKLGQVVAALGGELHGDPQVIIDHLASIEHADHGSLTFVSGAQYKPLLEKTKASAVILRSDFASLYKGNAIIAPDPYLYYAKLTQWWQKLQSPKGEPYVSDSATIHPSASVDPSATIEAGAVIAERAVIQAHVFIGAQSYIGADAQVGQGSYIAPQVSIMHGCIVGKRAFIYSGAVIGADGFGYARNGAQWQKIAQFGTVIIGDEVEIGANTTIDRGAIDNTVIGNGVKLDNLIQIGHNVHIGDHTAMASCVGISGSTHIGKRCIIGGAVGVAGHIEIVDDVIVMAATNVTKSIMKAGCYSGIIPFDEAVAWRKNSAMLRHLTQMRDRVRELEKQVSYLTSKLQDGKSHD